MEEAKKKGEKLIITGDLNCKVGNLIDGNRKDVTKSGPLLKAMISKHKLKILNSAPQCEGKWTRIEGEQKSILDYVIVNENEVGKLKWMKIDEEKLITPYTITKGRMIPSDHCAITASFDWTIKTIVEEPTYIFKVNKNSITEKQVEMY